MQCRGLAKCDAFTVYLQISINPTINQIYSKYIHSGTSLGQILTPYKQDMSNLDGVDCYNFFRDFSMLTSISRPFTHFTHFFHHLDLGFFWVFCKKMIYYIVTRSIQNNTKSQTPQRSSSCQSLSPTSAARGRSTSSSISTTSRSRSGGMS